MVKHIKILNRVSTKALLKMKLEATLIKPNNDWFYVAPADWLFDKGYHFDTVLGLEMKKTNGFLSMRLQQVVTDEKGTQSNKGIPIGVKTLCRFQFDDFIPRQFRNQKMSDIWSDLDTTILVASSKDLQNENSNKNDA